MRRKMEEMEKTERFECACEVRYCIFEGTPGVCARKSAWKPTKDARRQSLRCVNRRRYDPDRPPQLPSRHRSNYMMLSWIIICLALFGAVNLEKAAAALTTDEESNPDPATVFVANCTQFQIALESKSSALLITVQKSFLCHGALWDDIITIRENVTVVGLKIDGQVPTIDFGDSDWLLQVTGNSTLRFENLVLLHDYVTTTGPLGRIPYVVARGANSVQLSGVVVAYRFCKDADEENGLDLTNGDVYSEVVLSEDDSGSGFINELLGHDEDVSVLVCECDSCCGNQNGLTVKELVENTRDGLKCWVTIDVDKSNLKQRLSSQYSSESKENRHVWIWVWTSVALVAILLIAVVLLTFAVKRLGSPFHVTRHLVGSSMDSVDPSLLSHMPPARSLSVEMKLANGTQPSTSAGQQIDARWTPYTDFDEGVVRELPAIDGDETNSCDKSDGGMRIQFGGLDVELQNLLGKGGFSCVYKGYYKGEVVAIKIMEHDGSLMKSHGELFEAFLNRNLVHPNVVRMLASRTCALETIKNQLAKLQQTSLVNTSCATDGYSGTTFSFTTSSKRRGNDDIFNTFIVMEYCDGGTLAQATRDRRFFNDAKCTQPKMMLILMCAIDVAYALQHLHSQCVIHGDLKPDNVLLQTASQDSRGFVCKVGDFGLSRIMQPEALIETLTIGTITHMPPELLSKGTLGMSADVYSFGILLWSMISGSSPFPGLEYDEIIMRVVGGHRPPMPAWTPPSYARLVRECWHHKPDRRPNFKTITEQLRSIMFECMGLSQKSWGALDFADRLERESSTDGARSWTSTWDGARILGSTDASTQAGLKRWTSTDTSTHAGGRRWGSMGSTMVERLLGSTDASWRAGSTRDLTPGSQLEGTTWERRGQTIRDAASMNRFEDTWERRGQSAIDITPENHFEESAWDKRGQSTIDLIQETQPEQTTCDRRVQSVIDVAPESQLEGSTEEEPEPELCDNSKNPSERFLQPDQVPGSTVVSPPPDFPGSPEGFMQPFRLTKLTTRPLEPRRSTRTVSEIPMCSTSEDSLSAGPLPTDGSKDVIDVDNRIGLQPSRSLASAQELGEKLASFGRRPPSGAQRLPPAGFARDVRVSNVPKDIQETNKDEGGSRRLGTKSRIPAPLSKERCSQPAQAVFKPQSIPDFQSYKEQQVRPSIRDRPVPENLLEQCIPEVPTETSEERSDAGRLSPQSSGRVSSFAQRQLSSLMRRSHPAQLNSARDFLQEPCTLNVPCTSAFASTSTAHPATESLLGRLQPSFDQVGDGNGMTPADDMQRPQIPLEETQAVGDSAVIESDGSSTSPPSSDSGITPPPCNRDDDMC